MLTTPNSNYHLAVVFYPWKNPYPLENTKDNNETVSKVVFASGPSKKGLGSGITSVRYSRTKNPGGSLSIEFTGYIQEEPILSVGTWCVLYSSHEKPLLDKDGKILDHGLVRFIGQVYEINSDFYVDSSSGRLGRKVVMTIREWSHVLHVPVRYHPTSREDNTTQIGTTQTLAESAKKRAEIITKIGTSVTNVFQQPALALAWVGGLTAKTGDTLLKVFGDINIKDLTLFSTVVSRLPALPQTMLKDLFPDVSLQPDTAWSEGFLSLLSGVQNWGDMSGDWTFWGLALKTDEKAERPIAPTVIDFFTSSSSLHDIVASQVSGGGGVELFSDLWYVEMEDGTYAARPAFVVRDIPFTLRSSSETAKFPWTYYDDLPTVPIPFERIKQISLKQSIHNTANLIQMKPMDGRWNAVAQAAALNYFGTTILPESQRRFGGQTRPTMAIRDIFMPNKSEQSSQPAANEKKEINPGKQAVVKADTEKVPSVVDTEKNNSHFEWFAELSKRHILWYGSDYLFPSGTMVVWDADFPLSCGVNIEFTTTAGNTYVGHCEAINQVFVIDPSGRIANQTTIQFSRLCMMDADGKLAPMEHHSVVNLLNQVQAEPTKAVSEAMKDFSKKQYQSPEAINTEATKAIIKKQIETKNTVDENAAKPPGTKNVTDASNAVATKEANKKIAKKAEEQKEDAK